MLLNLDKFFRETLYLLLALYFSQGALYETGSIIGKLALFLILLICFFYFFKTLIIKSKKPLFYYVLVLFVFMNILGFIITGNYGEAELSQIKSILTALLPFFPFYYFSYKNNLNKNDLLRFFLIMLPVTIWLFYSNIINTLSNRMGGSEDVVSNTSYLFVMLMPYIFFWHKKIFSNVSLILLLYFVIQGSKRGALLVLLVGILIFLIYQILKVEPKKRIFSLFVTGLFSGIIGYISYLFYLSNEFFVDRWQEVNEGGSGRDLIYSNIFNSWYNSDNILNFLFGYGFMTSVQYSGSNNLAHNDWLEVLINFGFFGFLVYFLLISSLFLFVMDKNKNFTFRFVILAIVVMWVLKSLFSMYYMALSGAISFILMGYILGQGGFRQTIR